jgi:DNA-binding XRE family transcriptional regulator
MLSSVGGKKNTKTKATKQLSNKTSNQPTQAQKNATMYQHKEQSKAALLKLKALADGHKITNTAMAEKIGVRPATVGQMFSGKFHPTLDNVFRALNALNDLAKTNYSLSNIDPEKA